VGAAPSPRALVGSLRERLYPAELASSAWLTYYKTQCSVQYFNGKRRDCRPWVAFADGQ